MNAPSCVEAELSTPNFLTLAQLEAQKLSSYISGKPVDELARELSIDPAAAVKLTSDENPLGTSLKVLEAIRAELAELTRYPDGDGFELRRKLAKRCAVDVAQVTPGDGSSDILDLVARAYPAPGLNAVLNGHTSAVYPIATQAAGAEGRAVKACAWGRDLEVMLTVIDGQTRVVFIANPNNSTGTWSGMDALKRSFAQAPVEVLVALDEIYVEYAEGDELPDGLDYLTRYSNLLVSWTLSKACDLASLWIGYVPSSRAMVDVLNRVCQPFSINSPALMVTYAAPGNHDYLAQGRHLGDFSMVQLEDGFHVLGLSWIPPEDNFIVVDLVRDAGPVYQVLLHEGVIVRPVAGYGTPVFPRISTGLPEGNDRSLQVLGKVLAYD